MLEYKPISTKKNALHLLFKDFKNNKVVFLMKKITEFTMNEVMIIIKIVKRKN